MIRNMLFTSVALLAATAPAFACNVPVFRFSLERWQPDRYEMIVIHRGPLTAGEQELVNSLKHQAEKCNLGVSMLDWNSNEYSAEAKDMVMERYKIPQFPWVIVRYPSHDRPAYAGPLDAESLRNFFDSPARTEVGRRLLQGESAVWLLLESGDATKDDDIAAKLKTWLKTLETTLKLPALTNSPKDKLLREDLPLKMSFSIVRVSRTAAVEKHFVHILRHLERDLDKVTEPIVIPVIGRGRSLEPLSGKGITERNVESTAMFLTGACACEVKEANPGVDLLMSVDWNGAYVPAPDENRTLVPVETPWTKVKQSPTEDRTSRPQSTTPPEIKSAAEMTAAHAGVFRVGHPLLAAGVFLAAIVVGYYGTTRSNSRPSATLPASPKPGSDQGDAGSVAYEVRRLHVHRTLERRRHPWMHPGNSFSTVVWGNSRRTAAFPRRRPQEGRRNRDRRNDGANGEGPARKARRDLPRRRA